MTSARIASRPTPRKSASASSISSLRDSQATAGEPEDGGRERVALDLALERLEHLLRRDQLALLEQRAGEDTAVEDAKEHRSAQLGRGERGTRIDLGGGEIAETEREPPPQGQPDRERPAVAARPRLRDGLVEQRPQLAVTLRHEERHGGLREPGCVGEPGSPRHRFEHLASGRQGAERQLRAGRGRLVGRHRDERRGGEELGRRGRGCLRPFACSPAPAGGGGRRNGIDQLDSRSHRVEKHPPLLIRAVERRPGTVEHVDGIGGALRAAECDSQDDRGVDPRRVVHRGLDRTLEVGTPLGDSSPGLRDPERKQNRGTLILPRRLGERPAEIAGGALGSAGPGRHVSRIEQAIDAPRVGRRVAREQVLGDTLLGAGLLGEK